MAEYIEKQVALDRINQELRCGATADQCGLETAYDLLLNIPPADVRPVVRGRWEEHEVYDGDVMYVCSECLETWTLIEGTPKENNMNYCPKCGSMMDCGDAK